MAKKLTILSGASPSGTSKTGIGSLSFGQPFGSAPQTVTAQASPTNTMMQPKDFGFGSYLVETPGLMTKEGGLLTVLDGENPTGVTGKTGIGLDYYDSVTGKKQDMSRYLFKGEKGYYNVLPMIAATDNKIVENPSLAKDFIKGDPAALKQVTKFFSDQYDLTLKQAQNPMKTMGDTLKYNANQYNGPDATGRTSISKAIGDNPASPMTGLGDIIKSRANEQSLAITEESPQRLNQQWIAANISKFEQMPAFISNEDIKSGAFAQQATDRTRKAIGKPVGYGSPVFHLLSGAPPSDTLLGG